MSNFSTYIGGHDVSATVINYPTAGVMVTIDGKSTFVCAPKAKGEEPVIYHNRLPGRPTWREAEERYREKLRTTHAANPAWTWLGR